MILLAAGGPRSVAGIFDASQRLTFLAGVIATAAYPLAFYTSMAYAGVAVGVTATIGFSPIAAALFERVFTGRKLSVRFVAATCAAVAGVAVLGATGVDNRISPEPRFVPGVVLGLAAGACYGAYTFAAARLIQAGRPSRQVMGSMFGAASVVLLGVVAVTGGALVSSARGVTVVAYLAVIPMGAGYLLFGRGLRGVPASVATALSLLEPVVAAVIAEVVLHQRVVALGWAGIGVVALSIIWLGG